MVVLRGANGMPDAVLDFFEKDGTTPASGASLDGAYYAVVFNGWGGGVKAIAPFTMSGSKAVATGFTGSDGNAYNLTNMKPDQGESLVLVKWSGNANPTVAEMGGAWYSNNVTK